MTSTPPERNNPGYTPEYKELEEARGLASLWCQRSDQARFLKGPEQVGAETAAILRWLAAEVRVMRLERALEQ